MVKTTTPEKAKILAALDKAVVKVTYSMPLALITRFRRDCKINGVSMSGVIIKLIEGYLK